MLITILNQVLQVEKLGWVRAVRLLGWIAALDAARLLYIKFTTPCSLDDSVTLIQFFLAYVVSLITLAMFDFGDKNLGASLSHMKSKGQSKLTRQSTHNHGIMDLSAIIIIKVLLALATFFAVRDLIWFEFTFAALLTVDVLWLLKRTQHFRKYGPTISQVSVRHYIHNIKEAASRWAWINLSTLALGLILLFFLSLMNPSDSIIHGVLIFIIFARNVADLVICHPYYLGMLEMK